MLEIILALDENESTIVVEEEKMTPNELVFKVLPKNLCYAFLGENGIKLVIISSTLNEDMETKLLEVLKNKMKDFAWSITDIKGISPSVCMHKIYENMLLIEHQRRLNSTMKEVMKKEVLKWLHVGFIYVIYVSSQCKWFLRRVA